MNRSPIVIIHNSSIPSTTLLSPSTSQTRSANYTLTGLISKIPTERKQSPIRSRFRSRLNKREKRKKRNERKKKNELLRKEKKEIGPLRRDDPSLIKTRSKLIPIKNRERAALMLLGYTGIIFVPGGNFLGFATKGGGQKTWREEGGGRVKESRTFYTAPGQVSSLTQNKLRRMALTLLHPSPRGESKPPLSRLRGG